MEIGLTIYTCAGSCKREQLGRQTPLMAWLGDQGGRRFDPSLNSESAPCQDAGSASWIKLTQIQMFNGPNHE